MLQRFSNPQQLRGSASGYALSLKLGFVATAAIATGFASPAYAQTFSPSPGDLIVSGSTYAGYPSLITVGEALPGGGNAIDNGGYPEVFQNDNPDSSFGVTSPIMLWDINPSDPSSSNVVGTYEVNPSSITTSFSSKSELAINLTPNGTGITFMGYDTGINQLDISNSNTPGINYTGNTDSATPTYREVAQINFGTTVNSSGNIITPEVTTTNAYPGNNGRAAILASNGLYYTVGNAGNGGTLPTTVANATGVQIVTPGTTATSTTPGTTQAGSYNITQNGYTADKASKDNNFRGETIFNNTLYVTKGSGSNGINSVYQVGTAGTLPTGGATISILPGFSTTLANSTTSPVSHPFGIWFANATTLYVADEGDGVFGDADATNNPLVVIGGLEKWSLASNGTWVEDYNLTNGLDLGVQYSVAGLPASYDPATDGLRNLTGECDANGNCTLYAVTSTVDNSGSDEGADPNEVVEITDALSDTTLTQAANEQFSVVDPATDAVVYRGVALDDVSVPEPSNILGSLGVLGFGVFLKLRKRGTREDITSK